MTTFSIIQKSQLEGAMRLDAEYYQPEYLDIEKIIDAPSLNSERLDQLISRPVVTGSTPKQRECKNDGSDILFIKTDTLRVGEIVFDFADKMPADKNCDNSEPREGDILVTIIGATHNIVGRAARVFKDDPKMNINQNIALIRPGDKILSGFLTAFLMGKFGRFQLWQKSRQTEQVNLNCREVELIKVPVLDINFQKDIDQLIEKSHLLKQESINILKGAESFLLEELGLNGFDFEKILSSIVNFSDVLEAERMDAEYFQVKYNKLINSIKTETRPLKDVARRKTENIKIISKQDYNYIEISDINVGNGEASYNIIPSNNLPANAKMKISGGELIVSKVRPTRGAIAIIPDDWKINFVASGAFSVFDAPSPLKEYLQVILRSIVGKLQLEKPTTGTSYPTVTDKDVENILIPILPKQTQQKIANLVRQSHEARKKAKELLEEAKRKVEEMIEKN